MKELWHKYRELVLYAMFGFFTFLVDFGIFFLLDRFFDVQNSTALLHLCSVFSTLTAITFAYITNRRFVFRSNVSGFSGVMHEILHFYAARIFTMLLAEILLEITVIHWRYTDWLMKLLVNILVIILNYLFSKLWIFKTTHNIDREEET